jgi:hypothetical protein
VGRRVPMPTADQSHELKIEVVSPRHTKGLRALITESVRRRLTLAAGEESRPASRGANLRAREPSESGDSRRCMADRIRHMGSNSRRGEAPTLTLLTEDGWTREGASHDPNPFDCPTDRGAAVAARSGSPRKRGRCKKLSQWGPLSSWNIAGGRLQIRSRACP